MLSQVDGRAAECEQCDLVRRRVEERREVESADSAEDGVYCIIHLPWVQTWRAFIEGNGPLPGPISNKCLLDATGDLLPGLVAGQDYRSVHQQVWKFLLRSYGGGPPLRRASGDLYGPEPERGVETEDTAVGESSEEEVLDPVVFVSDNAVSATAADDSDDMSDISIGSDEVPLEVEQPNRLRAPRHRSRCSSPGERSGGEDNLPEEAKCFAGNLPLSLRDDMNAPLPTDLASDSDSAE